MHPRFTSPSPSTTTRAIPTPYAVKATQIYVTPQPQPQLSYQPFQPPRSIPRPPVQVVPSSASGGQQRHSSAPRQLQNQPITAQKYLASQLATQTPTPTPPKSPQNPPATPQLATQTTIQSSSPTVQRRDRTALNYDIEDEIIGEGAYAKVKAGRHRITKEKVALKIFDLTALDTRGEELQKVHHEIDALKRIRHPHVIRLLEVVETPRQIYLVMDYIPEGELYTYITSIFKIPLEESKKIFGQLVAAVSFLHEKKIAHRDIKPENILLDEKRNVRLIDFGLSVFFKDDQRFTNICGSLAYIAPEMLRGEPYDVRKVDIWSLGIVLYALLVGTLPFEDEDQRKLQGKVARAKIYYPPYLHEDEKHLLKIILNPNPNERASLSQIMEHPWIQGYIPVHVIPDSVPTLDDDIISLMSSFGFERGYTIKSVTGRAYNDAYSIYVQFLLKKRREQEQQLQDDIQLGSLRRTNIHSNHNLYENGVSALSSLGFTYTHPPPTSANAGGIDTHVDDITHKYRNFNLRDSTSDTQFDGAEDESCKSSLLNTPLDMSTISYITNWSDVPENELQNAPRPKSRTISEEERSQLHSQQKYIQAHIRQRRAETLSPRKIHGQHLEPVFESEDKRGFAIDVTPISDLLSENPHSVYHSQALTLLSDSSYTIPFDELEVTSVGKTGGHKNDSGYADDNSDAQSLKAHQDDRQQHQQHPQHPQHHTNNHPAIVTRFSRFIRRSLSFSSTKNVIPVSRPACAFPPNTSTQSALSDTFIGGTITSTHQSGTDELHLLRDESEYTFPTSQHAQPSALQIPQDSLLTYVSSKKPISKLVQIIRRYLTKRKYIFYFANDTFQCEATHLTFNIEIRPSKESAALNNVFTLRTSGSVEQYKTLCKELTKAIKK